MLMHCAAGGVAPREMGGLGGEPTLTAPLGRDRVPDAEGYRAAAIPTTLRVTGLISPPPIQEEPLMTDNTPAGWYPDGTPNQVRYWNGAQWTEHTQPAALPVDVMAGARASASSGSASVVTERLGTPSTTQVMAAHPTGKPTRKFPSKWWHWGIIALAVIVFISIIVNGANGDAREAAEQKPVLGSAEEAEPSGEPVVDEEPAAVEVAVPETTGLTAKEAQALIENEGLEVEFSAEEGVVMDRDNWVVLSTTPSAGDTVTEGDTVVVNVEKPMSEEEKLAAAAETSLGKASLGKQNALEDAKNYLDYSSFSKAGLLQQLTSEYGSGYERADAAWAIKYLEKFKLVSWNAEAAEAAEDYLEYSSFSRDGLYQQLTSEYGSGFTPEQAAYALKKVGY